MYKFVVIAKTLIERRQLWQSIKWKFLVLIFMGKD